MVSLDLTAAQCRFVANVIDKHMQVTGLEPMGYRIIQGLVAQCGDSLADTATVTLSTDAVSVYYIYPLIDAANGEADGIRADMKASLMGQIVAGMASSTPAEWNTMASMVQGLQTTYDNNMAARITDGKDFLQSLR